MQQHSFIPLRHKDPLHKHIHNFAFPDGFFIQASPGAEDGVSYTDFQFQAASTESNSFNYTLCSRTLILLLLVLLRHLHKLRTDDRFLALSGDGSLGGSYDYAYPYLRGSTLGGTDFGALVLSRYRSGSAGKLVTVGAEGNLIASLDTQRDVLDISAAGKYLAVLYSDELVIYTSDLAEYASLADTQYARGVRMRADGSAVLLGSQHGWLFVP